MTEFYYTPVTPEMNLSKKGFCFIAAKEAVILTKYLDSVNVQTIGIGATKSDIPDLASWPWDKEITIQQAFDMYLQHVQKYANAVSRALTVNVSQAQFDALVSICYNIGFSGMANSTFIKRINSKESLVSVKEAILRWNKPKEILGRRNKEANLFVTGDYGDIRVLVAPVINKKPRYAKGYYINALDYL